MSKLAEIIDDTKLLEEWKKRRIARGFAAQPALLDQVRKVPDDTPNGASSEKEALNGLIAEALAAGDADKAAAAGTAQHSVYERVMCGQSITDAKCPPENEADVRALLAVLEKAGLHPVAGMFERTVVNRRVKAAGTFDLLLRHRETGAVYMADYKTGKQLKWSQAKYAAQLAGYASAEEIYDYDTETFLPMPPVDQDRGVIIHVQVGSGIAELHWIDLEFGRRQLDLCVQVREIRKANKNILCHLARVNLAPAPATTITVNPDSLDPFRLTDEAPAVPEATLAELREWVTGRLAAIKAHDPDGLRQVAGRWPVGVPTLKASEDHTAGQYDQIALVLDQIEPEVGLNPFEIPGRPHEQATAADREWWLKQLDSLPADLRSDAVKAAGVNLDRSTRIVWANDIRRCKAALAGVQPTMDARVSTVDAAVDVIDPERTRLELVARTVSCHKVTNVDLLEHRHLAPLQGLAGLVAAGLAAIGPDEHGEHRVHWPDPAGIERHLVGLCGNKTAAVTAGKTLAGLLGGLKPQTFQQLLGSPGLVAGIHHQHTTKPQLSKGTAA